MLKGCGVIAIGLFVLFIGFIVWALKSKRNIERYELPKVEFLTNQFIKDFNDNNFENLYKMMGLSIRKRFNKEKSLEHLKQAKEFSGNINSATRVSWNYLKSKKDKFIFIIFLGKNEKGNVLLTLTFQLESDWKIVEYNFKRT